MSRSPNPETRRRAGLIALAAALALGATAAGTSSTSLIPADAAAGAGFGNPGLHRRYGAPVQVGNGRARTYVVWDGMTGAPVEVGVALDETAMEGLPVESPDHGPGTHGRYSEYLLELPARNPTPYRFVELDWNPQGHGAPHTAPHFDFHFYRIPLAERNAIDLRDSSFARRAANLPAPEYIPEGYASTHVLLGTTPAGMTVPRMGLHWVDVASPELPPQSKPFTATYIVGSWDGQVIFDEPMVTREFIMAQREAEGSGAAFPVAPARRYAPAGFYPSSYAVAWDGPSREYRIALRGLTRRD